MPSGLFSFDNNFPTFTGEESPQQQIRALHNYLFQVRESLQYSLQNLSEENFNPQALQSLTDKNKQDVEDMLAALRNQVSQLSSAVANLSARVDAEDSLAGRVSILEEDVAAVSQRISLLEEDNAAKWQRFTDLEVTVSGEGGLLERMTAAEAAIAALMGAVQVAEDGEVTVGQEGTALHLIGNVDINGTPAQQGGEA